MLRGVIYTAITGKKDRLYRPSAILPGVDYICFTDDPEIFRDFERYNDDLGMPPLVWRIRLLDVSDCDPTLAARRPKVLPHEYLQEYDWSLWIDGNFEISGDLTRFIASHLTAAPFHAMKQFQRRCVYEEFDACVKLKKDSETVLRAQETRYRAAGMPTGLPVASTCVLLRFHKFRDVSAVMEAWWQEIIAGSRRDQVSLPFVLWKHHAKVTFFFGGHPPFWHQLPFLVQHAHLIKESKPWPGVSRAGV